MGDGGDAHVKSRGEGVKDLVGAHMGVGVNDTLAAALHDVGCEVGAGVVECALPAPSNAASLSVVRLGRDSRGSIDYGGLQVPMPVCSPPSGLRISIALACWLAGLLGRGARGEGNPRRAQLWSAAN